MANLRISSTFSLTQEFVVLRLKQVYVGVRMKKKWNSKNSIGIDVKLQNYSPEGGATKPQHESDDKSW